MSADQLPEPVVERPEAPVEEAESKSTQMDVADDETKPLTTFIDQVNSVHALDQTGDKAFQNTFYIKLFGLFQWALSTFFR